MEINLIQDEIIEEFSSFDDWMDRYSLLIEYGNGLEAFPEADKNDKNLMNQIQLICNRSLIFGQRLYCGYNLRSCHFIQMPEQMQNGFLLFFKLRRRCKPQGSSQISACKPCCQLRVIFRNCKFLYQIITDCLGR